MCVCGYDCACVYVDVCECVPVFGVTYLKEEV